MDLKKYGPTVDSLAKSTKMFKGLKHFSYEEKLKEMSLFSLDHLRDSSSIDMTTRRMGAKRMEPASFQ